MSHGRDPIGPPTEKEIRRAILKKRHGDCLYVMRIGDVPRYKIGRSTNLESRLACYRSHVPFEPDIIALAKDGGKLEHLWLKAFFPLQVYQDWHIEHQLIAEACARVNEGCCTGSVLIDLMPDILALWAKEKTRNA